MRIELEPTASPTKVCFFFLLLGENSVIQVEHSCPVLLCKEKKKVFTDPLERKWSPNFLTKLEANLYLTEALRFLSRRRSETWEVMFVSSFISNHI